MDIERRFHQEMVRIYREATEFGYYPNYFLRMVVDQGGLAAAKQLLSSGDPSSGFVRLWQEQRLRSLSGGTGSPGAVECLVHGCRVD